jgi:hypothetical protein
MVSSTIRVCPGHCNAAWRASQPERAGSGESSPLPPRLGAPVWCSACSRAVESALQALPRDIALLRLEMEHGTARGARERVSGTRPRPLHAKESLSFLADDVYAVLVGWEDDVRDGRQFSARAPRGWGRQVDEAARFLAHHFAWLMEQHPEPGATVEFGREVLALHQRVRRAVQADDQPVQRCEGVRCPRCLMKALVREQNADRSLTGYVLCQGCGNLLSESEYQDHVKLQAKGTRKLVRRA